MPAAPLLHTCCSSSPPAPSCPLRSPSTLEDSSPRALGCPRQHPLNFSSSPRSAATPARARSTGCWGRNAVWLPCAWCFGFNPSLPPVHPPVVRKPGLHSQVLTDWLRAPGQLTSPGTVVLPPIKWGPSALLPGLTRRVCPTTSPRALFRPPFSLQGSPLNCPPGPDQLIQSVPSRAARTSPTDRGSG